MDPISVDSEGTATMPEPKKPTLINKIAEKVAERALGIPADISEAYDRLRADGMPAEQVAPLVVAMKKQYESGAISRTVRQQVDHLLDLRKSLRK